MYLRCSPLLLEPRSKRFPLFLRPESLLCPVRALKIYIERSASYRKSEQLFVGFGNRAKGGPVTKQIISRWLVDAISLAYSSVGSRCPIGVRAHSTRGIASSWAWSSGVSMSDICEAAGWSSLSTFVRFYNLDFPAVQTKSPFCLIAIFRVHLTKHCSSPLFCLVLVRKLYRHQVSLWDDTRATDDPLVSPCAWCILRTPLF